MDKYAIDHLGYDQEELYFEKKNRELIERRRHQHRTTDWHCPKCGGQMEERSVMSVTVERCVECHGVFFDEREFNLLIRSSTPKLLLAFREGLARDRTPLMGGIRYQGWV